jgi:hypothetical protein
MALTKTAEFRGINIANAYYRVSQVQLGKSQMTAIASLHASAEAPELASTMHGCPYDIEGDNPIKQAYEHLKTLPEFEGAIDC